MGIELELAFLCILQLVGNAFFAPFEVETPPWKKILKWGIVATLTLGLYPILGHASMLIPGALALAGFTFHLVWCKRNGIDSLNATPRRRYYELRGWPWPGDARLQAGTAS